MWLLLNGSYAQLTDYFWATKFTTHWLALSVFTGQYIKIATQTPLLLNKNRCIYCPKFLNFIVLLTVLLYFFCIVYTKNIFLWLDYL